MVLEWHLAEEPVGKILTLELAQFLDPNRHDHNIQWLLHCKLRSVRQPPLLVAYNSKGTKTEMKILLWLQLAETLMMEQQRCIRNRG
ncbi:unnamed protein product [Gongylonema pulchrum]|uniref:Uncharacterized protein n=1 Tax=Gongylonema pulchrum TaxID=637853 RepID=A0A183DN90_9BILA|nr:unnamed protein product [Gongylonema pulchrum]